jgi:hypothetical protein
MVDGQVRIFEKIPFPANFLLSFIMLAAAMRLSQEVFWRHHAVAVGPPAGFMPPITGCL